MKSGYHDEPSGKGKLGWRLGGLAFMSVVAVLAALFTTAIVWPMSPRPAYADHNSMYVICPDPIPEGNSSQMGVRRSGYKVKWVFFATDHQYHTADGDDYEQYHGKKIESGRDERTVWAPIVTKEDTEPEHDETFVMGFWDGGVWHQCVITIQDDDAPTINVVNISSQPVDQYAYRAGESIDIAVDLDAKVEVQGNPLLALFLGDENGSSWRGAEYLSGSGTRSLVFRYRVRPEDFDPDGIKVGSAAVDDDRSPAYGFSGSIFAKGTDVPINYAHPGVEGNWRQKVDGRPYVQSTRITSSPTDGWDAYRTNQTIEISMRFDTEVVVEGEVTIDLYLGLQNYNWDEATRRASYLRGSGTDTLVFGYTIRPGDTDPEGVGIILGTEEAGFGGSGTIKAKGTDIERNPWYLGSGHQPEHKVDTTPPAVSSVSLKSRPANGDAYGVGEVISVEIEFNEKVTLSGELQVELDVGEVTRYATLGSRPGGTFRESLVLHYTVQEGDADIDGVGIGANRLTVNGGGVHDIAGNAASLSHPAVAADAGHKVATS